MNEDGVHPPSEQASGADRRWALKGASAALSVPAIVLCAASFGFGGLAHESGFDLPQSAFMAVTVFALPSMVVLVGSLAGGAGLLATAFAVTLSAVRLMPMTVALVPLLRGRKTPLWKLAALSHFVAVTVWVESMRRLPPLPQAARLPFYAGFGFTLMSTVTFGTVLGHVVSGSLPVLLAAALFLLTPIYFLLSLTNAARSLAERLAMPLGLALGPLAHVFIPGADLLVSGLVAGTLAFALDRLWRRR